MKKQRFPALFLALALCLGLAVPAFAADTSAEFYTYISEDFPYVNQNLVYKVRKLNQDYTYDEAADWNDTLPVSAPMIK